MSIYETGAEAFRDTTKWLVAFVPVASLIAAGALIGPRLIAEGGGSDSALAWAGQHLWPIVGIASVVVGVGVIVFAGAWVLSTQPKDLDKLLREEQAEKLSAAFSAGVGAPYFLDENAFRSAISTLQSKWNDPTQTVTEAEVNRASAATDGLRSWALQNELAARFNGFRWWFGGAIVLIVGGSLLTTVTLGPTPAAISDPVAVHVTMGTTGSDRLLAATGCTEPAMTRFVAVGGTWETPLLETSGPGCRIGATWQPGSTEAQIWPLGGAPSQMRGPQMYGGPR